MSDRLVCHYAKHPGAVKCSPFFVRITFHDKRGCFDVCDAHAQWRMTTSTIAGHGQDCPHAAKTTGPLPGRTETF